MNKWIVVMLVLGLAALAGCGEEDGSASGDEIEFVPDEVPRVAQGNNAISVALKHYIVETDKRLQDFVIQVDGLKVMNRHNPAIGGGELQELTVWLEDSLDQARKKLEDLRMAPENRVESLKADLEALIIKMDERCEVAMGLARGAYKSSVNEDEQFESPENSGDSFDPSEFDESQFNPNAEQFK